MAPPRAGTCSRPSMEGRKNSRSSGPRSTYLDNQYSTRACPLQLDGRQPTERRESATTGTRLRGPQLLPFLGPPCQDEGSRRVRSPATRRRARATAGTPPPGLDAPAAPSPPPVAPPPRAPDKRPPVAEPAPPSDDAHFVPPE